MPDEAWGREVTLTFGNTELKAAPPDTANLHVRFEARPPPDPDRSDISKWHKE